MKLSVIAARMVLTMAVVVAGACGGAAKSPADLSTIDEAQAVDAADPGDLAKGFTVSVSPVPVEEGSSVAAIVTVTRLGGYAETIALSTTALPFGMTASFAPDTLAGSDTSSTLTLHADIDTPAGAQKVTVRALSAPLEAVADATVTVSAVNSVTVTGKVVDYYGTPTPGATVRTSQTSSTTTDANGDFSLTAVPRPYTIVIDQGGLLDAYVGLFRSHSLVLLQSHVIGDNTNRSAKLTATVTGITTPLGTNEGVAAFGSGPASVLLPSALSGSLGFTRSATWAGSIGDTDTLRVAVLGFSLDPVDKRITGWLGYGATDVSLTHMVDASFSITAAAVPVIGNATLTMTGAGTPVGASMNPLVALGGRPTVGPLYPASLGAVSSVPVPNLPGVTIAMQGWWPHDGKTETVLSAPLTAGGAVSLPVPPAPTMMAPADFATTVSTTTPFQWSATPNAVYVFELTVDSSTHRLMTGATTLQLSSLSQAGITVTGNTTATWRVTSNGPSASIDEVAQGGPQALTGYSSVIGQPIVLQAAFAGHEQNVRTFTTVASP